MEILFQDFHFNGMTTNIHSVASHNNWQSRKHFGEGLPIILLQSYKDVNWILIAILRLDNNISHLRQDQE